MSCDGSLPAGRRDHPDQTSAVGYASSTLAALHFGLGPQTVVPHIEIVWPSGTIQELWDVKADQRLVIREPPRP